MLSNSSTVATASSSLHNAETSKLLNPRSNVSETVTSDVAMTSTEASYLSKILNTCAKKPCCPNIRVLLMTIIVMPCLLLMAATRRLLLSASPMSVTMRVPGTSGCKELRTLMGTLAFQAGMTAAGCTTFAPNIESSAASSKVNTSTCFAFGTMRGSMVRMPVTSFQICTSEACTAAPMTVAVKSEPSRPRVVIVPLASFAM
mmetsp:Transcript_115084/g.229194  ORF Transcript_115084/g.229194 Transcript_115084/m.229194 type:complete len:202 (+) Transcript_115084:243-848(+)